MTELFTLLLHLIASSFRSRTDLILENLLLRQQLQVALRPKRRLPLRRRDELFWLVVWRLRPDWRRYLLFVRPETVIRWVRRGWRWYWRWRSRIRIGRPRLSPEIQALIARMAKENPLWGTERIRGELLKLGLVVSARSIGRYRSRHRRQFPPFPGSSAARPLFVKGLHIADGVRLAGQRS